MWGEGAGLQEHAGAGLQEQGSSGMKGGSMNTLGAGMFKPETKMGQNSA